MHDFLTINAHDWKEFEVELEKRRLNKEDAENTGSIRMLASVRGYYNDILVGDEGYSDEELQIIRMGFQPNLTIEVKEAPFISKKTASFDQNDYNWDGTEWCNDAIDCRHEREY